MGRRRRKRRRRLLLLLDEPQSKATVRVGCLGIPLGRSRARTHHERGGERWRVHYKDSPTAKRIDAVIEDLVADRDQIDWAIAELTKTRDQLVNGHAQVEQDAAALLRDRILGQMDGKMQRSSDLAAALFGDSSPRGSTRSKSALEDLMNEGLVNKRDRGWYESVEKPPTTRHRSDVVPAVPLRDRRGSNRAGRLPRRRFRPPSGGAATTGGQRDRRTMTLFQGDHDKKAELIKRAVEHREADRLIQQYGFFEPMDESEAEHYNLPDNNGEKSDWQVGDWAGCAIGCLATEVLDQDEYRRLFTEGELYTVGYDDAVGVLARRVRHHRSR